MCGIVRTLDKGSQCALPVSIANFGINVKNGKYCLMVCRKQ